MKIPPSDFNLKKYRVQEEEMQAMFLPKNCILAISFFSEMNKKNGALKLSG